MRTILSDWQSFEREVVPVNAPVIQREECRRAFYAGAAACFTLTLEATFPTDEDQCERNLQAIEAEIRQFPSDLRVK